ncbi:hypothetical protein ACHHYP_20170 [Achlya hypogyna]|uniref:Uncharacterized protein n=1 Tax=Achlya hypogyna TaxID=1202772 RepID=A0A1V9ZP88_ACHHY|nr:hypothetical protein ACHHYP_20170 [Achlya hypogyna]
MKSGKLAKHSQNFFRTKWSDKWVHLDAHALRWYPMLVTLKSQVVDQSAFALYRTKASKVLLLHDYTLVAVAAPAESRLRRKHCFQLVAKNQSVTKTFACANERELVEWVSAIHQMMYPQHNAPETDGDKRRSEAQAAFKKLDVKGAGKIDSSKLRLLLEMISFYLATYLDSIDSLLHLYISTAHQLVRRHCRLRGSPTEP